MRVAGDVLAHLVSPGGPPQVASWLGSLALFGGAVAAYAWWGRLRRRTLSVATSGAGLVASAALMVMQPSLPMRPGYGIALAAPRSATSPVAVRVCSVDAIVSPAPVPGPGRLLRLLVDGRQVAETASPEVALTMSAGRHSVLAQLITSDHRPYTPPITATATVVAGGVGPVAAPPACSG